jgi:hypothetical protein
MPDFQAAHYRILLHCPFPLMDINPSGASRRLGLNVECWMFALLPEAAKMMAAKNECEHDQYVPRHITARLGDEVKLLEHARSLRRQADRAGG